MKIIILGAGQVGGTLAENLVGENNDITVVDTNGDRLRSLQDKFDLRVVQGHGSHPRVLREAGADDADMLVAVTSSIHCLIRQTVLHASALRTMCVTQTSCSILKLCLLTTSLPRSNWSSTVFID